MKKSELYNLPKDLLVKLICEIQDKFNVENFTNEQCREHYKKVKERNSRIVAKKVRDLLLVKDFEKFKDIIVGIRKIIYYGPTQKIFIMWRCHQNFFKIDMRTDENEIRMYLYNDFVYTCTRMHDVGFTSYEENVDQDIKEQCDKFIGFYNFLVEHDIYGTMLEIIQAASL